MHQPTHELNANNIRVTSTPCPEPIRFILVIKVYGNDLSVRSTTYNAHYASARFSVCHSVHLTGEKNTKTDQKWCERSPALRQCVNFGY